MKFFIQLIITAIAAFTLELFLPWWSIAIAAFITGYLLKSRMNFLAGFLGVGLLWCIKAWLLEATASATLTDRVAAIFKVGMPVLLLITCIIGGLVGGFAAMSGASLKRDSRRY
jgi:hypothetical protein